MATDNFIPEIWAAGVTQSFQANQVIIPTLGTQFTGNVTAGNKVHIINATTPTVVDYAAAGRTISAEALADTEVQLLIDQEKAFSVNVDDVDVVQASSSFGPWVESAGKALAEDAEEYLLAQMLSGASDGQESTPVVVNTPAEAQAAVLKIRKLMSINKVPSTDRFLVVNPDFADLLLQSMSDVSSAGRATELHDGELMNLRGFVVKESPLLAGNTPTAIGYHKDMVAFASQISSLESLRNPTRFSDIVRGLSVYGARVLKSEAVVKYVSA